MIALMTVWPIESYYLLLEKFHKISMFVFYYVHCLIFAKTWYFYLKNLQIYKCNWHQKYLLKY